MTLDTTSGSLWDALLLSAHHKIVHFLPLIFFKYIYRNGWSQRLPFLMFETIVHAILEQTLCIHKFLVRSARRGIFHRFTYHIFAVLRIQLAHYFNKNSSEFIKTRSFFSLGESFAWKFDLCTPFVTISLPAHAFINNVANRHSKDAVGKSTDSSCLRNPFFCCHQWYAFLWFCFPIFTLSGLLMVGIYSSRFMLMLLHQ